MRACLSMVIFLTCFFILIGCGQDGKKATPVASQELKNSQDVSTNILSQMPDTIVPPKNMVWISGKAFLKGAVPHDSLAMPNERPAHKVVVDGFFMDVYEVTNAAFKKFVDATNYKTIAERPINWDEMKKQLPPGAPKPHDSIMQPGSLVFKKAKSSLTNLYDFSQWWEWKIGANWKHPKGPESTIEGKENHPVVHIAYEDAQAYCAWAGRRLPTEAEWELAARGRLENTTYSWGNEASKLAHMANSWEGEFPVSNTLKDAYEGAAPIGSYPANSAGLYDLAGNVWEWTSDWYNSRYYTNAAGAGTVLYNPQGAAKAFNRQHPYAQEKIIKGGSFLCNEAYCANYRISARMGTSTDSSQEHLGFRTVVSIAMLSQQEKLNKE